MLALLSTAALACLPASGADWQPDLQPAMELARQQGKDLLVDFTGSDWCGWCIRLDKEVFSQPEFQEYAKERFILVSLDFPRAKEMPADLKERNATHRDAFGVEGYPTILLLTPDGVVYGRTGYKPGGAPAYVAHLDELQQDRRVVIDALKRFAGDPENASGERLAAAYEMLDLIEDGPQRKEWIEAVRLHDPADSRLVLARQAVAEFEERLKQTREPDWKAVSADLEGLAERQPLVSKLGIFHCWKALAQAQDGDLAAADSSLATAKTLGIPDPDFESWLTGVIDEIRLKASAEPSSEG